MQKGKFSTSVVDLIHLNLFHFRLFVKIIQVGFFAVSIFFLFITMIVVSAGWGKTCATLKNIDSTRYDCYGPHRGNPPNGADFITAAVSQ